MGWVWKDDDESDPGTVVDFGHSSSDYGDGDMCSTRKVVRSNCKTEQVEPGKFIRKCEKTQEVLRNCVGKPTEVLESTTEYTEEDATEEMLKGSSSSSSIMGSSGAAPFDFPGLRGDIEAIERSLIGGISSFFDKADGLKNEFFRVFDDAQLFGEEFPWSSGSSSSPSGRRDIPIEDSRKKIPASKPDEPGYGSIDLSGATEV